MLARVLDPAAYPLASRVGSAAGAAHGSAADPDHAYRFGLDRVLDGLAAFVERGAAAVEPDARRARPTAVEWAPAGPAGRLDALDTEIHRGRRARAADPVPVPPGPDRRSRHPSRRNP